MAICIRCETELTGKQTKFCSRKCKNDNTNRIHQVYEAQRERGTKRKIELIEEHGGKCSSCGYDKNYAALVFHHLDPSKKEFELDVRKMANTSFNLLEKEANKCIVLCHNCHMEEHYPQCNKK